MLLGSSYIENCYNFLLCKLYNHQPVAGCIAAAKVARDIKAAAKDNIFTSATKVVEDTLRKYVDVGTPCEALKPIQYYCRNANNARKQLRPADLVGLNFEIEEQHLPDDFLKGDLTVDEQRHVLFATSAQLTLLHKAKRVYADGTFKVVREPFVQLWSLHTFVREGDHMKQVKKSQSYYKLSCFIKFNYYIDWMFPSYFFIA